MIFVKETEEERGLRQLFRSMWGR